MNKTLKSVLSIVLCVLMAFGTVSVAFAADDETAKPSLGAQYYLNTTDAENAALILDELDKVLKEKAIYKKVVFIKEVKLGSKVIVEEKALVVDLRSINGLCKTIDNLKGLINVVKHLLGDLSALNLNTWEKGLKRGAKDYQILTEFVELVGVNAKLIGKFVEGNLDLGLIGEQLVDLDSLIGKDGVSGLLKGMIVEMLYKKDSAEYNAAYTRAKNDFDKFLFEEFLPAKLASAVPGFKMSTTSKVDVILSTVLASCWKKYIEPAVKALNITAGDNEALKKLGTVMTFQGSEIDTSLVKIDGTKPLSTQINDILGTVAVQLFKGFEWEYGTDVKLVGKNIQKLYEYVAKAVGIEATPIAVLKFVLENIEGSGKDDYVKGIDNCKTLEEVAKIVLINTAKKSEIPVKENVKSYENVLGDMLAYWANNFVDLGYGAGTGKDVWTVLNDFVNVYLFDKGVAKALGINKKIKASDSFFKKLDTVINLTGIWDIAGKSYKSEEFLKDVLNGLFTLDFDKLLSLTVVRFSNDFGSKTAVEVLYKAIYNLFKSLMGKEILVAYNSGSPFQTALSNTSLKKTVVNLLSQLYSEERNGKKVKVLSNKKSVVLPPVLFAAALALGTNGKVAAKVTAAACADTAYTGAAVIPAAITVTVNGRKVTIPSYQYTVKEIKNNVKIGKATVVAELNGAVKNATVTAKFNIVPAAVTGLKVATTSTTATLTWSKVVGATAYIYEYYNGKKWVAKTTTKTSATISKLKANTAYKFRVRAYNKTAKVYGAYSAVVSATTAIAQVKSLKAKATTSSSVTLTWGKVSGAKSYEVYQLVGKKWKKIATTTKTSVTVKKLKANTTYQFKVRAISKKKVAGDFSAVLKVTTNLTAVKGVKAKTTKSSVALSWKKVSGAKSYEVWQLVGKKWKKVGTSSSTKFTVKKGLKKNTKYQFKVRAVSKAKVYGEFSAVVKTMTKKK